MKKFLSGLIGRRSKSTKSTAIEQSQFSTSPCERPELSRFSTSGQSPRLSTSSPPVDLAKLRSLSVSYSASSSHNFLKRDKLLNKKAKKKRHPSYGCIKFNTDATFCPKTNYWYLSIIVWKPGVNGIFRAKVLRLPCDEEFPTTYQAELAAKIEALRFFLEEVKKDLNIFEYCEGLWFEGDNKDVIDHLNDCLSGARDDVFFEKSRKHGHIVFRDLLKGNGLRAKITWVERTKNKVADKVGIWAKNETINGKYVLKSYVTREDVEEIYAIDQVGAVLKKIGAELDPPSEPPYWEGWEGERGTSQSSPPVMSSQYEETQTQSPYEPFGQWMPQTHSMFQPPMEQWQHVETEESEEIHEYPSQPPVHWGSYGDYQDQSPAEPPREWWS